MQQCVGLWINRSKNNAESLVPQLIDWFKAHGWKAISEWSIENPPKMDFIVSLGGDGTVLEAAREAAPYDIPVLGVNYGRLGFLCEVERGELYSALEKVINREYILEERLMMIASLENSEKALRYIVLNDVVFLRESSDSLITLQVKLSGDPILSPSADGLIVATPTGSTAYSLSAGGPVVSPEVEAMLITYIAPHALSSRPLVISHNEIVDVSLTRGSTCRVTFDGKHIIMLKPGDTIRIVKSPIKAKFIRLKGRSFHNVVKAKLRDR